MKEYDCIDVDEATYVGSYIEVGHQLLVRHQLHVVVSIILAIDHYMTVPIMCISNIYKDASQF